jgi:hemin uptake protein HemP
MQSNSPPISSIDLSHDAQSPLVTDGGSESPRGPARISSYALLLGANEIEIEHKGALYRLRQTSLGKLILTK